MAKYNFNTINSKEYDNSLEITYGFHSTPFGKTIIGVTKQGICHLSFVDDDEKKAIERLQKDWPNTQLNEDKQQTQPLIENIFDSATAETATGTGKKTTSGNKKKNQSKTFDIFLKGTDFQIDVWKALTAIPIGTTSNYEGVATMIGNPKAIRAAASALIKNPVGYLIPCHRVIRKTGDVSKYRWGAERKKKILAFEANQNVLSSS